MLLLLRIRFNHTPRHSHSPTRPRTRAHFVHQPHPPSSPSICPTVRTPAKPPIVPAQCVHKPPRLVPSPSFAPHTLLPPVPWTPLQFWGCIPPPTHFTNSSHHHDPPCSMGLPVYAHASCFNRVTPSSSRCFPLTVRLPCRLDDREPYAIARDYILSHASRGGIEASSARSPAFRPPMYRYRYASRRISRHF